MKYEYKVIDLGTSTYTDEDLEKELNDHGARGYRPVQFLGHLVVLEKAIDE